MKDAVQPRGCLPGERNCKIGRQLRPTLRSMGRPSAAAELSRWAQALGAVNAQDQEIHDDDVRDTYRASRLVIGC